MGKALETPESLDEVGESADEQVFCASGKVNIVIGNKKPTEMSCLPDLEARV